MKQDQLDLETILAEVKKLTRDQQQVFELGLHVGRSVNNTNETQYLRGWNAALDMAALRLTNDFKLAFGADTCASWAIWLKEQKK
jgi:hypothetical protein